MNRHFHSYISSLFDICTVLLRTLYLTDLHNGFRCGRWPLPGFHQSQVTSSFAKSHHHQNPNFATVVKFSLQIWHIIYISDDLINYIDKKDLDFNSILASSIQTCKFIILSSSWKLTLTGCCRTISGSNSNSQSSLPPQASNLGKGFSQLSLAIFKPNQTEKRVASDQSYFSKKFSI